MSDYYFKQYYDSVRDESWPIVKNYTEFLSLPAHIINECKDSLNLNDRLNQLESKKYWLENSDHNVVYVADTGIGYVPTYKCAHSHYTHIFESLGWKKLKLFDINPAEIKLFGLMMNPYVRRLKGISQFLINCYNSDGAQLLEDLKSHQLRKFIANIFLTDIHTLPCSISYGDYFNKIDWIPLDIFSDSELKTQIESRSNCTIPDIPRINKSSESKKTIFSILEKEFLNGPPPPGDLGVLYADDLKMYNSLINRYKSK